MDEFVWQDWPIQTMNAILDKWRLRLDARYSDRYAAWEVVLICCNSCPSSWYAGQPVPLVQSLRRRIQTSCRLVTEWGTFEATKEDAPNPDFTPLQ